VGGFADFSIRAGMIAFLSRPGAMQNLDAARVILGTMVGEEGEEGVPARAEAARLIAMLPDEFGPELGRLLADPDPAVVRPALSAMGALQRSDLIEQALPALARQELHADALPALVALGEAVVPRLGDLLSNGNGSGGGNGNGNGSGTAHKGDTNAAQAPSGSGKLDAAVRREIPLVLAHIGGSEARRILTDHLLEADVILRFRVIAALNKLHQLHPDIELDRRPIEMVLTAEIMGHYRSYQIMGKLGDAFEHADPVALSLKQSMDHEVERIFRLMQLRWPQTDMYSAYVGLQSQNPSVRANALEFLDNILQPQVRSLIVPLLDSQVSVRERVALANRLLGMSVETPEQAVAALVASDDPWMRASGAYAIGMLRLTSLAPELDRLASTDDPLLRETVRAAREKLTTTAKPALPTGEITPVPETWEAEQQSMGIG
jgi:ATP:ADP antiporter, AAA family